MEYIYLIGVLIGLLFIVIPKLGVGFFNLFMKISPSAQPWNSVNEERRRKVFRGLSILVGIVIIVLSLIGMFIKDLVR